MIKHSVFVSCLSSLLEGKLSEVRDYGGLTAVPIALGSVLATEQADKWSLLDGLRRKTPLP